MEKNTLLTYKQIGETPLDVIMRLKKERPQLADKKMSYAGRLDPMAEGLLLLLLGEENKKRKEYETLTKTYIVEILLGVSTDTYDVLGLVTTSRRPTDGEITTASSTLTSLRGKHTMQYPPYSSKPVNGKPLYYWARENLLHTITLPTKLVELFSLTILGTETISGLDLATKAIGRVTLARGDFRQEEICKQWDSFASHHSENRYSLVKAEISCSSGTYMRTIAHMVGEKTGIPSLAFSIKRTKIGTYLESSILDDNALVK